jgi:hypothetical protein
MWKGFILSSDFCLLYSFFLLYLFVPLVIYMVNLSRLLILFFYIKLQQAFIRTISMYNANILPLLIL